MHDKAQIRFVEAHAQRRGGDERLDLIGQQCGFQSLALGRIGLPGVGGDMVPMRIEHIGEIVRGGDGERVNDAGARQFVQPPAEPGGALHRIGNAHHRQVQRFAIQPAAQNQSVGADLGRHVGDDAIIGGGRGGEHRHIRAEIGDERADSAIVGPEVMAPVRDAVRLVDHDEPGIGGQLGQHRIAEVGIVQTLGTDQQHIDLARGDLRMDIVPFGDVARIDRCRNNSGSFGRDNLVAHERQQW